MKVVPASIPDGLIFEPKVFRGFFLESWNARGFRNAIGGDVAFVQDNHSRSRRGIP
jgi:dTDP-4-dehydrorhamnose 3,5-epimerase